MEQGNTDGIVSDDKNYMQYIPLNTNKSNSCILEDMETGASDDLNVLNKSIIQVNNIRANHLNYSSTLPPFTVLKKCMSLNCCFDWIGPDMKSMRSVIASITPSTGVTPVVNDRVGVISSVKNDTVTLSFMDINSGINDEKSCKVNDVSLHTTRYGFYFNSLASIRSCTCHIGSCLLMSEMRDLLLICLTTWDKLEMDYLALYDIDPNTLVSHSKWILYEYRCCTSSISSSSTISSILVMHLWHRLRCPRSLLHCIW